MARSGGFGTSINPFGTGSFGGLAQYNIGDSVKDLARYQAEIAWGNGQMSNEAYLAILQGDIAKATPGTQDLLAAQNKYDDVAYRINRAAAEDAGLDALIAFDQQTLGTMNPSNLRYGDVQDSLNSELARRRSRDYGVLVDEYNAGKASTESLLSYVKSMVGSLSPDAPDFEQWSGVVADLTDRLATEKDSRVYQDYQDRKMKPDAFLAYVQGRRDSFSADSPKWDEWDRRLTDAQKNVKDAAQSQRDSDVFNRYNEGKISDKTYLRYLQQRVDGMAPDDPALGEWKHRLTTATFSLAEDLLTYEVNTGKQSLATLKSFYSDYATTLNRGSAEWRRINEKVLSLTEQIKKGSGGGGGGTKSTGPVTPGLKGGKVITADLNSFLHSLTPNPTAPSKSRVAAENALKTNYASLQNAVQRGDTYFVFYDPTKPGQVTARRDPMTGQLVKDKSGKQQYVVGSGYFATSSQALSDLDSIKSGYSADLASVALAQGRSKDYWRLLTQSLNEADSAKLHESQGVLRDTSKQLDALDAGIKYATSVNDAASVVNYLILKGRLIDDALANPSLNDARRETLTRQQEEIGSNPLFPSAEARNGTIVQTGGWIDAANSPRDAAGNFISGREVMDPNVHFVLDNTENGKPAPKWVYDDAKEGVGVWEATHVPITTNKGDAVFTGEVTLRSAPVNQTIVLRTNDGEKRISVTLTAAKYITYTDGDGKKVTGYSLNGGRTWLMTDGLQVPVLEIGGANLTWATDANTGAVNVLDAENNVVMSYDPTKGWQADDAWLSQVDANGDPTHVQWYGQDRYSAPRTDPNAPRPSIGGEGTGFTLQSAEADGSLVLVSAPVRRQLTESARLTGLAVDIITKTNKQKAEAAVAARYTGVGMSLDPKFRAQKATEDRWTAMAADSADKGSKKPAGYEQAPAPSKLTIPFPVGYGQTPAPAPAGTDGGLIGGGLSPAVLPPTLTPKLAPAIPIPTLKPKATPAPLPTVKPKAPAPSYTSSPVTAIPSATKPAKKSTPSNEKPIVVPKSNPVKK